VLPRGVAETVIPVLRDHGVSVCYVFGSRVSGASSDESDLDLAVVFREPHPGACMFDKEVRLEGTLDALLTPLRVDVTCLQRAEMAFRYEVVAGGVVIYSEDEDFRLDFEESVVRDYLDFSPVLTEYYRIVREEILHDRPNA